MDRDSAETGLKAWRKPKVRRLASGGAEENANSGADGSGWS